MSDPRNDIRQLLKQWVKERPPEVMAVITDVVEEAGSEEIAQFLTDELAEIDLGIRRRNLEELIGEQGNLEEKPWVVRVLTTEAFTAPDGTALWAEGREPLPYAFWMAFAPEWLTGSDGELDEDGTYNTVYSTGYRTPQYLLDAKTQEIWKLVWSGAHTPERECPFRDWDPKENTDAQDRHVELDDTYYGGAPGERCRFCDEAIGEHHGYLYEEGSEEVYQLLVNARYVELEEDYRGRWRVELYETEESRSSVIVPGIERSYDSRNEAFAAVRAVFPRAVIVEVPND